MDKQPAFSSPWERALLEAAQLKLDHLYEFDNDFSGVISNAHVQGMFDTLCVYTDMRHDDNFPFSENGNASLSRINDEATELMQARAARPYHSGRSSTGEDDRAAIALRDAILLNLPALTTGETCGHALAMSKAMYANFERLCFYRADFETVSRVILVQDYSAMKLAGRPAMEIAREGSEASILE
ncbi:hypothetical protein AWM79_05580 [Pseudomonas agarici]|uniref:Uncharacterized protein n=1 Tax=Pseudomonas agarici TaxID=46677 RepID=A0A0X1SY86_PSEAA|nr:hypothetical protein [Pseudomonas agarici]AMB84807.1 hypothetical protein AWM79_05580 [Pseudomonas agarici]